MFNFHYKLKTIIMTNLLLPLVEGMNIMKINQYKIQ